MSWRHDDITPDVDIDPSIISKYARYGFQMMSRDESSGSIQDCISLTKQAAVLPSRSVLEFTERNFVTFPLRKHISTNQKKWKFPCIFLDISTHTIPFTYKKFKNSLMFSMSNLVMNYGSHITTDYSNYESKYFAHTFQYFNEKDSVIMYNKEKIRSQNDQNSYMFHRLKYETVNNLLNDVKKSNLNMVVCICIFSEIRNFMRFTFREEPEYASKKPRAWFKPRNSQYNPSTLPQFLMENIFAPSGNVIEEQEFSEKVFHETFLQTMGFEFNPLWNQYKKFIIQDFCDGDDCHTAIANFFFNECIFDIQVKTVTKNEKSGRSHFHMPDVNLFKTFIHGGKNENNDLFNFDDVPFVWLRDLFQIANFGPLPGGIPLFMSTCYKNSDKIFIQETTGDPIPHKDRLPSALAFYHIFLSDAYVQKTLNVQFANHGIFPKNIYEQMISDRDCYTHDEDICDHVTKSQYQVDSCLVEMSELVEDVHSEETLKQDISGNSTTPSFTGLETDEKQSLSLPHAFQSIPSNPPYRTWSTSSRPRYLNVTIKVHAATLPFWIAKFQDNNVSFACKPCR